MLIGFFKNFLKSTFKKSIFGCLIFFISRSRHLFRCQKCATPPPTIPYSYPCNSMKADIMERQSPDRGSPSQKSLLFSLIFLSISSTIPRISKDKFKNNSLKRKDTLEDNFIAGLRRYPLRISGSLEDSQSFSNLYESNETIRFTKIYILSMEFILMHLLKTFESTLAYHDSSSAK